MPALFQIALVQTASTLPFFLFALPAGALGDIVDRRQLILVTEYVMLAAAVVLAAVTAAGMMSPAFLLVLAFLLAAGDAWLGTAVLAGRAAGARGTSASTSGP